MEELSDYSSEIIEFKPIKSLEKFRRLIDNCTSTDVLPVTVDISLETTPKQSAETQTETLHLTAAPATVDDKKLALWLRKIYPAVEAELSKGLTPLADNSSQKTFISAEEFNIQVYQKIAVDGGISPLDNSQGLATWLSVHTNNAPVLVLTMVAPHDDWCEHMNQSVRIYIPKRIHGNFIVFTETKSIPLKACLQTLTTNSYNKNLFVGATFDGDVYIWRYEQTTGEVTELFNFTAAHGSATAMDWSSENRLLTCHSNGYITQWLMGKNILKEAEFLFQPISAAGSTTLKTNLSNEITTLVSLSINDFVVGTKDGGVYHCWSSSLGTFRKELEVTPLQRHLFMVSSLLRTRQPGYTTILSCDLSGQVFYHDIRNVDDESAGVSVQIPLPFKNSIGCSRNGKYIYCPGQDGCLECFSLRSGTHHIVQGALRGKGSLIKCSENGYWIVTGLYGNEFQIFYIEN